MTHGITNKGFRKFMIHCHAIFGCLTPPRHDRVNLPWESPQPAAQGLGIPCGVVPALTG